MSYISQTLRLYIQHHDLRALSQATGVRLFVIEDFVAGGQINLEALNRLCMHLKLELVKRDADN